MLSRLSGRYTYFTLLSYSLSPPCLPLSLALALALVCTRPDERALSCCLSVCLYLSASPHGLTRLCVCLFRVFSVKNAPAEISDQCAKSRAILLSPAATMAGVDVPIHIAPSPHTPTEFPLVD